MTERKTYLTPETCLINYKRLRDSAVGASRTRKDTKKKLYNFLIYTPELIFRKNYFRRDIRPPSVIGAGII